MMALKCNQFIDCKSIGEPKRTGYLVPNSWLSNWQLFSYTSTDFFPFSFNNTDI